MKGSGIKNVGTVLATLALIGLAAWRVDATWSRPSPASDAYMAGVAEAIDSVPYKIGPWLGRDVEVSPAAVEMLKPNRILQRVYTTRRDGGSQFSLLISHCGRTRDMLGHYPPVCYPAHGWTQERVADKILPASIGGIPARAYEFTRGSGIDANEMSVVNFFVLPSETERFRVSMDQLNSLDVIRARHAEGIAQIQMLFSAGVDSTTQQEMIAAVLEAIEGVIAEITERSET